MRLGVSQRTLETEYYLVDIPLMLRFRSHELAEQQLISLQSYTVAQTTDKDAYQRYVDVLKAGLYESNEPAQEQARLDRSGLAELRNRIGRR